MERRHIVEFEYKGKIIRVAIYIRVSHEEQVRHGLSLEAQKEALIKYAKENGWKIVDFYIDEGITARKKLSKRKEFQRLLQDVKEDKIDVIIFIKLDRWFRNVADYYKTQEILEAHNVDWIATEEEYDTKTANGRLHLNIKLSIAQNESDQTSDRINFIFDNKRKNGKVTSGAKKFGFDINEDKEYVVNEEEQKISIDCANYLIDCGGSIKETMVYHNSKYTPAITYETMRKRLTDTANIGIHKKYKSDEVIASYTARIWTDELYENVQRMIERHIRISKKTEKATYDALFDGLLYCPCCHNKFTRKITYDKNGQVKYVHYNCWKSAKVEKMTGEYQCSNRLSINEKKLEAYLLENFKQEAEKYICKNTIVDTINEKPKKDNSAIIKKKMDKLADLYLIDKIDKDYYLKEYDKLKNELEDCMKQQEKRPQKDLSKVKKILEQDFVGLYNSLDNEGKRKFLLKTIDQIFIENSKVSDITFL